MHSRTTFLFFFFLLESPSPFPSAHELVRVVSSAEDEDETRGDQRADPDTAGATGTELGVKTGGDSSGLLWGARRSRDFWIKRKGVKDGHQPLKYPHPSITMDVALWAPLGLDWIIRCWFHSNISHVVSRCFHKQTHIHICIKDIKCKYVGVFCCLCKILFYDFSISDPLSYIHRCSALWEDLCRRYCFILCIVEHYFDAFGVCWGRGEEE